MKTVAFVTIQLNSERPPDKNSLPLRDHTNSANDDSSYSEADFIGLIEEPLHRVKGSFESGGCCTI